MKRALVLLAMAGVAATLVVSISQARKSGRNARQKIPRPVTEYHTKGLSDLPLDHPIRERIAAAPVTTVLADYTFDTGGMPDPQGWTSVDRTPQDDTVFHVADATELDGGYYGGLVVLEGSQSLWCGVDAQATPLYCSYATLPGYGNGWYQLFESATFYADTVNVSWKIRWDSEPNYDWTVVEYMHSSGYWVTLPVDGGAGLYEGVGEAVESHQITGDIGPPGEGATRIRFAFTSDNAYSDQDGLWDTDGACIVDSILVTSQNGETLCYEDFESESPGARATDDGLWQSTALQGYGDFAALYDAFWVLQEYPCYTSITAVWGFFADPVIANYACATPTPHPEQGAVPYKNSRDQYIHNEIWSPLIPVTGSGNSVVLEFDVYRDLALDALIFYTWSVRSWVAGCPSSWDDDGFVHYGEAKDWYRASFEIGNHIETGAESVQLAIGVRDMCLMWCGIYGTGTCHSQAPLFDNVRLLRLKTTGPVWTVRDLDLFQDNFSADGTTTGEVRVDMAQDIAPMGSSVLLPGDSACVTVGDPEIGLGGDFFFMGSNGCGPAVYCYISVDPNQYGPYEKEANDERNMHEPCGIQKRWPYVATTSAAGRTWDVYRADSIFTRNAYGLPEPVTDRYCIDFNDNLFTPGDTIYFCFSAKDAVGNTTYWSRYTGTTDSETEALSAPMEMTCLPANALTGATDILYVDDFDQLGAQPYFDAAFEALGITPDRYDVRAAESGVSNGLGSRANASQILDSYSTIIWNSGDLSEYTIGDGTLIYNKSDDATLLWNFLDNSLSEAGVYFSGDDLAEEWATLTGGGAIQLRAYMGFTVLNPDHVSSGLPVSPLVVGQSGSIFDHSGNVDSLIAFGGCPLINDFDVLAPAGVCSLAATYANDPAKGAVLVQETPNSVEGTARVALSGFSYHEIRNAVPGAPAYIDHLLDILNWFGYGGGYSPVCQVEPASVDFGTVFLDSLRTETFTIKNIGTLGDTLRGTVTETCSLYTIVSGATYDLNPGQSQTVTVQYHPTAVGPHPCTIETGLPDCADVLCTGFGDLLPVCQVEPTSIDFDTVLVGSYFDTTFIVANVGGDTLRGIVSAPCTHYSIVSGGGQYSLAARESLTVTVRFEPAVGGTHECSIETGDTLCGDVSCTGFGQGDPICQVDPISLDFDSVFVGSWKDTSIILTNAGADTLRGTVSETSSHYSIISGGDPYKLGNNDSLVVTVRFEPAAAGTLACTIETGDAGCSDVSCTGVGELPPVCLVEPATLAFDSVFVGSWKDTTFLITNTGGGTLAGSVSDTCSHYSIQSGGGPYSLAAEESLWVTVRFEPAVAGSLACSIETGDVLCSDVSCTGVGALAPLCSLSPNKGTFGSVFVGSWKDTSFVITNAGGGTLTGSVGDTCSYFSVVDGAGPFSLAAEESLRVTVRFEPVAAGSVACWFETGTELCNDVWFIGIGVLPPVCEVEPTILAFGNVFLGSSRLDTLRIRNIGGGTLAGTVSEACDHYAIVDGGGAYSLAAQESLLVTVQFAPSAVGSLTCTIETGDSICSDVWCTGIGEELPACSVVPPSLDFGAVGVDSTKDLSFTIKNTGGGTLDGTVSESCAYYSIVSGSDSYSLAAAESLEWTVRFAPTEAGVFPCTIETGNGLCSDVEVTGFTAGPMIVVSPSSIDFGRSGTGTIRDTTFVVKSVGLGTLDGNVSEACSHYSIESGAGPFSLASGESLLVDIRYAPTAYGLHECLIETNPSIGNVLAFVADGFFGFQVIDVGDPANPVFAAYRDTPDYARGVYVSGSHTFVVDRDYGLLVIDISNPAAPALVGSYDTVGQARGIHVSGDYAYMLDWVYGLLVIDVSAPNAPTLSGSYDTPGNAFGVYVSGDYAYVADGTAGLQVIDVSDPGAPALAGTYDTPADAIGVYVLGDLAYVADGNSGLRVIDVSDPAAPTEVGGYDTLGDSRGVYVSGDYAYVADGTAGLKVIDISDPSTPTLAGSYAYGSPSYSQNVCVLGDYAYVADGGTGLHVIDVSNPAAPTLTGAYDTPGSVNDVAVIPNGSVACSGYAGYEYAMIDSIVDVPGDQGGQVRIHMTRSIYDFEEETELPIYAYQVWRRVDGPAAAAAAVSSYEDNSSGGKKGGAGGPAKVSAKTLNADLPDWPLIEWEGRYFLRAPSEILGDVFPPGTWEYLHHVFAVQQQNYIINTSTLGDSSESGIPYAVFVITAHTTTPSIWFTSPMDSGYSVDNIAPGVPEGFAVAYNTGSGNTLTWDPAPEPDFQYYKIYRGTDPDFTPGPATLVDATASTYWNDPEYDGWNVYYKIKAVDHAGNESDAASPGTTIGIEEPLIPTRFAVYQNIPNPFNPITTIRYDVPIEGGKVTLRIYDVSGRLVRTLMDGEQSPGEKRVVWYGRDDRGNSVATGVYFYRMTAPGFEQTRKMVLLR